MPLVCLSEESYSRIEEYAKVAGIPVESAASKAVIRWMDASGDTAMSVLKQRRKGTSVKVKLSVKSTRKAPSNTSPIFLLPPSERLAAVR